MNKIKFDAKLLDLFSEDFDYLQDSIETEIYKIFKQVTTYNGAAAIIKGFTLGVSTSDSTKLMITHSGPFGSLVSKEGNIYESNGTIDNISLADYTSGALNYIYAVLDSLEGSYNRATKTFVAGQKKAIDLADYSLHYDRIQDSWEIEVLTATEFSALTSEDLEKRVYLGRVAANGSNQPITNVVDLSGRNTIKTHIQDGSITTSMISPTGFMVPQNQVSKSLSISDDFIDQNYFNGTVNLSSGYNWGVTNQQFIVDSGLGAKTITLTANCLTITEVRDHIIERLTVANEINTDIYIHNTNYIGIKHKTTGNIVLSAGTPSALTTLGWVAGTYSTITTAQDDLNKIRTHIKGMKGTLNWDDNSPTTLFDFDRSINAIHENGVFRYKDDELEVIPHTQDFSIEVLPGCANVNGGISRILETSTGEVVALSTPIVTTIGGTKYLDGEKRGLFSGVSYQFYIYNNDVTPNDDGVYEGFGSPKATDTTYVLITDSNNGPSNGGSSFGFIKDTDYTINDATGLVTIVSQRMQNCWGGLMYSVEHPEFLSETDDRLFKCYYKYGEPRWDAVTIALDNKIQVFTGTPNDNPIIPITSSNVVNLAYVYVKPFDVSIDSINIHDTRYYIDKVRELIDVPIMAYTTIPRTVEKINYFSSTGVVQTALTSTGNYTWKVMPTSTGDYCVYTTTIGSYLETVIYAKENDEIWLITDKTPWTNNITIQYSNPNSDTLSHTVPIDLFFNTRLAAYPVFVDNSLDEGYIKIRITVNNITDARFRLYNIIVGKLDLYYNKHSLSDIDYIVPQKITNLSGMNAKAYPAPKIGGVDNVRKGTLLLNTNTKEFCGYDGRQLNYWDIEQKYPVSRVCNYCTSTGYTTSTGYYVTTGGTVVQSLSIPTNITENTYDASGYFIVPTNIIGAQKHQRAAFFLATKGVGYTGLNLVIHDNTHTVVSSVATLAYDDITANTYNYFELPVTLIPGQVYHYHIYCASTPSTAPTIRCRNSSASTDKYLFCIQFYTPIEGLYKSNNVINFVKTDGTTLIAERASGTNAAGGRYDLNTLDIMAVDFSDNSIWESWEYDPGRDLLGGGISTYIGIDIKTGRIKVPAGYDLRDYFVEFNIKELGTKTDSKSYLIHGETKTVSDAIEGIKQGSGFSLNGIINGSFDVWQRVRKGSTDWLFSSVVDGDYTADMFRTYINGGTTPVVNISRVSGETSPYAMKIHLDSLAGDTVTYGTSYRMPNIDSLKFSKKKVTISLDLLKGSACTSDILLELYYSTTVDTFSSLTLVSSYTIPNSNLSTTSYRRFSNTFDLSSLTSMTNLVIRVTAMGTGTLSSNANRFFSIQNIQLNEGPVAHLFQMVDFNTTLDQCLPFYEKSYDYGIAPGIATNLGSYRWVTRNALAASTGGYQHPGNIVFIKRKYTTPSNKIYSEAGTLNAMTVAIGATTGIGGSDRVGVTTSSTLGSSTRNIATFIISNASSTAIAADNICGIHYVSSIEL